MKNKITLYLFMLTLISINCFNASSLFAQTGNLTKNTTLDATITGESKVCEGTMDVVYKTESGMINYEWEVSRGGIINSGQRTDVIKVDWSLAGDQTVSVKYSEPPGTGNIISGSLSVSVDPFPGDAGTMTGPVRVCQGDVEVIYSVLPISSALSYVWLIPDGASIISDITNTIKVNFSLTASPGNVAVYGLNTCGKGNVSEFYPVMVNEIPPTPVITIFGNLLQCNAADGNLWYLNGEPIPGATKQEYEATQTGRYYSIVTLGGCSSAASNKVDFEVLSTKTKVMEGSDFQIYPVPNDGQFIVKCTDLDKTNLKIQVYNNLGMVVYEKTEIQWDANSSYFVDLNPISAGTYAVIVQNDKYHLMKKLIITK